MANWHFVVPCDETAAAWLAREGYPHPPVYEGNRLPTWAEVEHAVHDLPMPQDVPLVIELASNGEALKVRGDVLLELIVLRRLGEQCGQLWVYPDCGSPAIVIDATSSPDTLAAAWLASLDDEDSWRSFYLRDRGGAAEGVSA